MKFSRNKKGIFGRSGFTLLEVLVALSVLAVAVTVILQLFSINLRSIFLSEVYVKGTMEAESKMREIQDRKDLPESTWQETAENGHRFEVSVAEALADRTENLQVRLVEIRVTVYWTEGGKERSSTVKTLKMVEKKV
jgi:general secretion pathway protein I